MVASKIVTTSTLRIVLIGGGTGSFTLLQELKNLTPNISALVSMSDDGGSTGKLRDEYGVLPPGDVRQCLVALSNAPDARDVFDYRYGVGDMEGRSVGNIILSALEMKYGDFAKAVKVASSFLNITGQVVPITTTNSTLVMHDGDEIIRGQYKISHRAISNQSARVVLDPIAQINPDAAEAIAKADIVVLAPGNLYGSLLPALVVDGVADALNTTTAKKVMVANLVTKPGQTDDWHVADYLKILESHMGGATFDAVLYNTQPPSKYLLKKYAAEGEYPVRFDEEGFKPVKAKVVGDALIADGVAVQDKNDTAIQRTLIRHNAKKVSHMLTKLYSS